MKTKLTLVLTLTAMTVALAINARAGHRTFPNEETGALTEPVKSVFESYLKIESALANESTVGIGFNASAIATAVRGDSMKMFPKKWPTKPKSWPGRETSLLRARHSSRSANR